RDGRLAVGRSVTEQAPSTTGAAHLRGRRACSPGPAHEVVDFRRRDARCKPLPVLPFGGDLATDFFPVASLQGVTHADGCIAYPSERVESGPIAVQVSFDDLPVVRARVPGRSGIGEDQPRLERARVDIQAHAVDTAHTELDGSDAAVESRPIVLNACRHA